MRTPIQVFLVSLLLAIAAVPSGTAQLPPTPSDPPTVDPFGWGTPDEDEFDENVMADATAVTGWVTGYSDELSGWALGLVPGLDDFCEEGETFPDCVLDDLPNPADCFEPDGFPACLGELPDSSALCQENEGDGFPACYDPLCPPETSGSFPTCFVGVLPSPDAACPEGSSEPFPDCLLVVLPTQDDIEDELADALATVPAVLRQNARVVLLPDQMVLADDARARSYFVALTAPTEEDVHVTASGEFEFSTDDGQTWSDEATVTFPASNGNIPVPQAISIRTDADVEYLHDQSYEVSHQIASADLVYNALEAGPALTVHVVDSSPEVPDDEGLHDGGFVFTPASSEVTIAEPNPDGTPNDDPATHVVFVSLDEPPAEEVTLFAGVPTVTDFTVQDGLTGNGGQFVELTWDGSDWFRPKPIIIAAIDDRVDEGAQTVADLEYTAISDDPEFGGESLDPLSVTTVDNDVVGFLLAMTDGSDFTGDFTLLEDEGTAVGVDVSLTSSPAGDVTLTIDAVSAGRFTADAATLTFTSADFDTPQTVTFAVVDDDIDNQDAADLPVTFAVDDAASSDEYDAVPDQDMSVDVVDNDTAGVSGIVTDFTVEEGGADEVMSIVLDSEPLGTITLTFTETSPDVDLSTTSLSFDNTNWQTPQQLTVSAVDDNIVEGDDTANIVVTVDGGAAGDGYGGMELDDIVATIVSDDQGAFSVSTPTLTLAEGASDTFTVILDFAPDGVVTLDVTTLTGEASAAPTTLVFDDTNWDVAQSVTVDALPDELDDDVQSDTVTVAVDPDNSISGYADASPVEVVVTITDDPLDEAGLVLSATTLTVNEEGGPDTFDVSLVTEPTDGDVIINVASSDTDEASVEPSTLTFTAADWDEPQTVTVNGVPDETADGDQDVDVTLDVDAASSSEYVGLTQEVVDVLVLNDDTVALTLAESTVTVLEGAGVLTVTVEADIPSTTPVPFTYALVEGTALLNDDFSDGGTGVGEMPADTLTTTFTIEIEDDGLDEDTETFSVELGGDNAVGVTPLVASIADNDAMPKVSFSARTSLGAEGDTTTSHGIDVELATASGREVTVQVFLGGGTADDDTDYTIVGLQEAPGTIQAIIGGTNQPFVELTIPAGQTTASVTVEVAGDEDNEEDETVQLGLRSPTNAVLGSITSHTFTIDNDDVPTATFDVPASSADEIKPFQNVKIVLDAASVQTVTLTISADAASTAVDPDDYTLSSTTVTFSPGQTEKTISVRLVDDADAEADEDVVLVISAATDAAIGADTHTLTIVDND